MQITKLNLALINKFYDLKFNENEILDAFKAAEIAAKGIKSLKNINENFEYILANDYYILKFFIFKYRAYAAEDDIGFRASIHVNPEPKEIVGSYYKYNNLRFKNLNLKILTKFMDLFENIQVLYSSGQDSYLYKCINDNGGFDIIHEDLNNIYNAITLDGLLDHLYNSTNSSVNTYNTSYIPDIYLFDKANKTKKTHNINGKLFLGYISEVLEYGDYRFAQIKTNIGSYWDNIKHRTVLFKHTDDLYNYVDAGNYVIDLDASSDNLSNKNRLLGKIVMMPNVNAPSREAIAWLKKPGVYQSDTTIVFGEQELRMALNKYSDYISKITQEEKDKKILQNKLNDKIKNLDKDIGFILNGMKIGKDSIVYENQTLELHGIKNWVKDIFSHLIRIRDFDDINFDNVFRQFIRTIENLDKVKATIGDVICNFYVVEKINKNGVKSYLCYINGFSIRDQICTPYCVRNARLAGDEGIHTIKESFTAHTGHLPLPKSQIFFTIPKPSEKLKENLTNRKQ